MAKVVGVKAGGESVGSVSEAFEVAGMGVVYEVKEGVVVVEVVVVEVEGVEEGEVEDWLRALFMTGW